MISPQSLLDDDFDVRFLLEAGHAGTVLVALKPERQVGDLHVLANGKWPLSEGPRPEDRACRHARTSCLSSTSCHRSDRRQRHQDAGSLCTEGRA